MLVFLKAWWKEAVIAALVVIVVGACHARDVALTERGRALEKVRVADSTLRVLRPALAKTDTLLQTRIRTVTQTIARVDTLRDSIFSRIHDSVFVTRFVERTDSAIKQCNDLLGTCLIFRTQANATIQALEAKVNAAPQTVKPARRCGLGGALGYSVTRSSGGVVTGPSLTGGLVCRLF